MDDFKKFVTKYAGAIIGVLVAIILLCTSLYKFIIWAVLIVEFGYFGYYIQCNKESVKEKVKNFIDRL